MNGCLSKRTEELVDKLVECVHYQKGVQPWIDFAVYSKFDVGLKFGLACLKIISIFLSI